MGGGMAEIRSTLSFTRRSTGVATVIAAILGLALTIATWGSDHVAGAADTTAQPDPLPVNWTGNLSTFPGTAWQQSWGLAAASAYRVGELQVVTDEAAPGGAALVVRYGAGS